MCKRGVLYYFSLVVIALNFVYFFTNSVSLVRFLTDVFLVYSKFKMAFECLDALA